jgi:hypothetical protein
MLFQFEIEPRTILSQALVMSKSVLGRGLGSLLNNPKKPLPAKDTRPALPLPAPAGVDRGLATLLQGTKAGAALGASDLIRPSRPTSSSRLKWFRGALIAGDILLLALAEWMVLNSAGPLTSLRILACAAAVTLGAGLALIACFLEDSRPSQTSGENTSPQWVTTERRDASGATRRFVIHLHRPIFVGEIRVEGNREKTLSLLWVEEGGNLSGSVLEKLANEARQKF